MNPRRGFTLLEILVSIVVTSVVALLVYGVADAAFTTRARLDERRLTLQAERAVRLILDEALRNARPALRAGDQTFVLDDARDAHGRPADRLTFVATGGFPPSPTTRNGSSGSSQRSTGSCFRPGRSGFAVPGRERSAASLARRGSTSA